ncbi:MAG: ATP-dependent DNA helicase [Candidatus Marinimicrobia bacterium]|nr:ATP-dependent DNA helicase [Candidatus Neomarinimicrobiota bacterium]
MSYRYKSFIATADQNKAILHPPAPLMILAGAGTGKTSTLLHRIRHLSASGSIDPNQALLLTFTEKATAEARHTIAEILGEDAGKIFVGTFHSFCHSIMRRFGPEDRVDDVLWQDSDILYFLIHHFNEMDFIQSRVFADDPVGAIQKAFIPFFQRISDELLSSEELESLLQKAEDSETWFTNNFPGIHPESTRFEDLPHQLHDLVNAYQFFQKAKAENNALDFGDMIFGCYDLLRNDANILEQVRQEFRHIFIDEYQDNNYALNKIVNLIAEKEPSITVVGDEDQCIYSFRGANYYNIQDFRNRYKPHPEYAEIPLAENRRSTQEILDLANASIRFNPDRTEKVLTCLPEDPKSGPKPLWIHADKTETLEALPMLIHSLINEGKALYGDIAVLCRGWGNVTDVAAAMQKSAIPVDIHIEKFFDVPIVKDVLAWGNLIIESDKSEMSLFRILRDRISENWAREFYQSENRTTLQEKLNRLESMRSESKSIGPLLDSIASLRSENKKMKADEMVWEILKELKHSYMVSKMRNSYRYAQRLNLANTGEILNIAEEFVNKDTDAPLEEWLDFMDVMAIGTDVKAAQPELEKSNIAVQVMTVHQSKGLQFPIVMLPFLYSSSFPSNLKKHPIIDRLPESWTAWEKDSDTTFRELHEREERRVFYVGITRAEKHLYLFGPTKRQSMLTKELEDLNPKPMEIETMTNETANTVTLSEKRQRLLADLNREVAANQIENARNILNEMEVGGEAESGVTESIPADSSTLSLSSTKIDTYNSCPMKYRLKYVDKVPEQRTRATGEFGSIIHTVLEEFHGLEKEEQTKDALFALLEKHWREDSFEYRQRHEEFKKQGEELLTDYFEFVQQNPPNVVGREKPFSYIMDDINVKISGMIDRIDDAGGVLDIVDYKTSRKKEKAEKNIQMALYTEAILNDAVPDISGEPGKASLHFLRFGDDPLSSHSFSEDELEEYREKISDVADGIRSGSFETKKGDFTCKYCDYKDFLCPAWEE